MTKRSLTLVLMAALALSACGGEDREHERARLAAEAADRLPNDPALAAIYQRSCVACHISMDSGAPILGDRKDWDERFKKGEAQVLLNAITGIRGMPPRGSCFDCTAEELAELTTFLSGHTFTPGAIAEAKTQEKEPTP